MQQRLLVWLHDTAFAMTAVPDVGFALLLVAYALCAVIARWRTRLF